MHLFLMLSLFEDCLCCAEMFLERAIVVVQVLHHYRSWVGEAMMKDLSDSLVSWENCAWGQGPQHYVHVLDLHGVPCLASTSISAQFDCTVQLTIGKQATNPVQSGLCVRALEGGGKTSHGRVVAVHGVQSNFVRFIPVYDSPGWYCS